MQESLGSFPTCTLNKAACQETFTLKLLNLSGIPVTISTKMTERKSSKFIQQVGPGSRFSRAAQAGTTEYKCFMNFGDLLDRIRTHQTSWTNRASRFQPHSFCGFFFKSKQEACWKLWSECGPCTMTMHSLSGLARIEVVQHRKNIFHLKKSCCFC